MTLFSNSDFHDIHLKVTSWLVDWNKRIKKYTSINFQGVTSKTIVASIMYFISDIYHFFPDFQYILYSILCTMHMIAKLQYLSQCWVTSIFLFAQLNLHIIRYLNSNFKKNRYWRSMSYQGLKKGKKSSVFGHFHLN